MSKKHNGLRWLGGDEPARWVPGVPARDLDSHDLEREVFKAAHLHPDDEGFDQALAALTEGLTRSELYEPANVDDFDPNPPGANSEPAPAAPEEATAPPSPEPSEPAPAAPEEA